MSDPDRCVICNAELDEDRYEDEGTICACCIADQAYREYEEYLDSGADD